MVMMFPPQTFECMYCGWSHTIPHPVSDCLVEGADHFRRCPDCGCPVSQRDATLVEIAVARLVTWKRRSGRTKG